MVCLTPSASATLGRTLSVHLPPNEGPRPLSCMLQRVPGWLLYLAVFGEEAGIRVPCSSSVYTQKEQAAAQWMRGSQTEGWRGTSPSRVLTNSSSCRGILLCRWDLMLDHLVVFLQSFCTDRQCTSTICISCLVFWGTGRSQRENRGICTKF